MQKYSRLLFHEALVESIRNKYHKAQGEGGRQIIAKMQCSAQSSLGFSKKKWKREKNVKVNYTYQRKRNRLPDSLISRVRAFYSRDDVSHITTGKRKTITRKKNKKQKRCLLDTMKNLHIKFLAEEQSSSVRSVLYGLFIRL